MSEDEIRRLFDRMESLAKETRESFAEVREDTSEIRMSVALLRQSDEDRRGLLRDLSKRLDKVEGSNNKVMGGAAVLAVAAGFVKDWFMGRL